MLEARPATCWELNSAQGGRHGWQLKLEAGGAQGQELGNRGERKEWDPG